MYSAIQKSPAVSSRWKMTDVQTIPICTELICMICIQKNRKALINPSAVIITAIFRARSLRKMPVT